MKIVRGYTVAGQLLVQGHSDLVAKVGDVVDLYLDQVSDPELPETIRATIEYPIVTLNCGTKTSYSFSYDETLLGEALSSLRAGDIVDVIVFSTVGRSAYESYLITTDDSPVLTEAEWVLLLETSAIWGGVTGTLADQTDLQAALDGKARLNGTNLFLGAQTVQGNLSTTFGSNITASGSFLSQTGNLVLDAGGVEAGGNIQTAGRFVALGAGGGQTEVECQQPGVTANVIGLPTGTGTLALTSNEDGTLSVTDILTAMGIPSYTDLAAANAALAIGQPYYDTTLLKLQITTA